MRDIRLWKKELQEQLLRHQSNLDNSYVARCCDVELALTLLTITFPNEPASVVPALLSGHICNPESDSNDQRRGLVAKARQYLRYFQGVTAWQDALKQYIKLPARLRLYDVKEGECIHIRTPSIESDRFDLYQRVLHEAPPHRAARAIAQPDRIYYFLVERDSEQSWIPVSFPAHLLSNHDVTLPKPQRRDERPALRIPWTELRTTAEWMDQATKSDKTQNWSARVAGLRVRDVRGQEPSHLSLTGLHHIAGMVSSGKSTLMDVVATWAAHRGLRTLVVTGDVMDVLDRTEMFCNMGLSAVPLLGATRRKEHHERILQAGQSSGHHLPTDPRLRWTSPVCFVDALAKESPSPLQFGKEPCNQLYEKASLRSTRVSCPLMPVCPAHRARNAMMHSDIWVATMQTLVQTLAPQHWIKADMRLLELAYRECDLFIVDEADRVQAVLDQIFNPDQILVGSEVGNGWLDRTARETAPLTHKPRRSYLNLPTRRWLQAERNAQDSAELIVDLASGDPLLNKWLQKRSWFTARRLLHDLWLDLVSAMDLEDEKTQGQNKAWTDDVSEFLKYPLASLGDPNQPVSMLSQLAWQMLNESPTAHSLAQNYIQSWSKRLVEVKGQQLDAQMVNLLCSKLLTSVATSLLDHYLKVMVDHWYAVAAAFDLYDNDHEIGLRPGIRDFSQILPTVPLGNLFGFRWLATEETGGGLGSFRFAAMGRWLLLHLHDFLKDLDNIAGPHVLLLSGTSWAPESSRYHVAAEPQEVLEMMSEDLEGISRSQCTFNFQISRDDVPIRVSGTELTYRDTALRELIWALAEREAKPDGRTVLQVEKDSLPPLRRKILLVTNSYDQMKVVVESLIKIPSWGDEVVGLVSDRDHQDTLFGDNRSLFLQRGQVSRFAQMEQTILVAPLLAIERGHNIVHVDGSARGMAAIGSVMFLVRPMPIPHNLHDALSQVHARSMQSWPVVLNEGVEKAWAQYRSAAIGHWHRVMGSPGYYSTMRQDERQELAWTQLVALWQTVGRAIRGGMPVHVHFVDAAFAPRTASGDGNDAEETSLLLAMRAVLLKSMGNPMAKVLYGPWAQMLKDIDNLT